MMRFGLVVEDLIDSALWLEQALLASFPAIAVTRAHTLQAAREALQNMTPDIALVDLDLPDGSGTELIQELSAAHPNCHSVVTSIFADDLHLFPALRAGAQGYLLKDQPLDRVIVALRSIAAGEPPLSPTIANRLLRVFNEERAELVEDRLSAREQQTLLLIAKGLKLADVAQQMNVTRNTAAGFVKAIYRKLKISTRAEAALEAARMGLIGNQL
ncbi:MAG: response regulator [Stenotrophobium sp.]